MGISKKKYPDKISDVFLNLSKVFQILNFIW